ncbi:MAG TPA: RNA polymerase sigma factor [Gaiellaceae bacterium]|nr:RNA polymerase sigma factor [Gaiellaceae bacterium]
MTVVHLSVEPGTSRPSAEPPDVELVRRAQLGSAAAFEQLVVSFGPAIHRFLSYRLGNDGETRDALQETLTAAWQGLPRLEDPSKLRAWLLGIAANKAADAARRRLPSAVHGLEPHGREDDTLLELREAILALPPKFRDVLLLRYVLDCSEEETAAALGIRLGTLKSRTNRARAALGELLR